MCAPVSATIVNGATSTTFATSLLINQVLAALTILSVVGYKALKVIKSI